MKGQTATTGFFERIGRFYNEVRAEVAKVSWPSKEQLRSYTVTVFAATAVVTLLIGVWDWVLTSALRVVIDFTG